MNEGMSRESERAKRLIAMGEMAASLAHEIRNPLGSMELFCSLLKKDLQAQPDLLNFAEQIHKGIRTLDRIITSCLQFSRDIVPQLRPVNVLELLEEIAAGLKPRIEALGIRLAVQIKGEGAQQIDRHQIERALLNLVLNAIDAVESKKKSGAAAAQDEAEIIISADLTGAGRWTIAVKDTGAGIAAEDEAKVFEPFFTTKEQGTGLGLAIVHSIINAHRGTISVASKPGRGTTVTVDLPK